MSESNGNGPNSSASSTSQVNCALSGGSVGTGVSGASTNSASASGNTTSTVTTAPSAQDTTAPATANAIAATRRKSSSSSANNTSTNNDTNATASQQPAAASPRKSLNLPSSSSNSSPSTSSSGCSGSSSSSAIASNVISAATGTGNSPNALSGVFMPSTITSSSPSSLHGSLWSHVGNHRTSIPPEATFDPNSDQIKRDLIGMIVQYLQQEGFSMSSATIQDEANIKIVEKIQEKESLRRMSKAIEQGEWDFVAKMISKNLKKFHSQQGFLYAVCKQEYFELIDRQEYQKAFTFLTTHLKPFEKISTMTNRNEFKELCYLLTCKSVGEVEAFRDWEGVVKSREKLAEQLRSTFELDEMTTSNDAQRLEIPDSRLLALLHQAVAYQMEFSRYHPKTIPRVTTLLRDFEGEVLPNAVKTTYIGHSQNVKYVTFVGHDGDFLASGSSDNTIKLWPVDWSSNAALTPAMSPSHSLETSAKASASVNANAHESCMTALFGHNQANGNISRGNTPRTSGIGGSLEMGELCNTYRELKGHSSRIWYLCANNAGDMLYSASGDGTVKIWNLRNALADFSMGFDCGDDTISSSILTSVSSKTASIVGASGASGAGTTTTSIGTAPSGTGGLGIGLGTNAVVHGGLHGTGNGTGSSGGDCVATLVGTSGDFYSVNLHPSETHLVTGGYDQTVRLYDIQSCTMLKTFRGHVASVCDAQFNRHANLIVSGSKDGTIRLWDILSGLCVHTLRQTLGEVTSISLASNGFTLLSGSRNNSNRLWDMRMLNAPRTSLSYRGGGATSGNAHLEQRPVQRFKGHQNTAKNVVRAAFGPREAFVLGGSEDGAVYVWDVVTGKLLEKLAGHGAVTYNAKWHEKQALMASSSHDGTVKTWWWQEKNRSVC